MRAVSTSIVIVAACGGTHRAADAPAPADVYLSVHEDHLAPDKVAQFVEARRAWVAELERANASDGRGVFVQVGDDAMFTMRRFTRFADFDTRNAAIDRSLAKVPKAAADAYDRGADTSLVFPHTSEIWKLDPDLSYAPAAHALDEATAGAGWIVLDDVKPDPDDEDAYGQAVAAEDQALAAARYPLTRLGFRTTFGAGHVITLWLAPSVAARDAAPAPEDAVAAALGADRAKALEARVAGALVHRERRPLIVRHDLTRLRAP
jgi:hypothetical protein